MALRGLAVPERRAQALSRVGAIVEEPHFHRHLTGRENLRVVAAVLGPETFARIDGALARVGLGERGHEKVSRYSQGMRQRLGVARCLLADPELLILDEPTNGLDPAGILEFRHMIRAFVDEGRTVFLSSHLLDEVEKCCDAAAIIDGGRIVTTGPIHELARSRHAELIVACDNPRRALELLRDAPGVLAAKQDQDVVRVRVARPGAGADINRRLVLAGIAVSRLEPVHDSLERRFLEITSRLEAVA
jgi:ABC-2 type transport system ATP-binding protein